MRLLFCFACILSLLYIASCSDEGNKKGSKASKGSDSSLVTKGKRLYIYCQACHETTTTESIKLGPHLAGIMNRQVGSIDGFLYSDALSQKDFLWDEKNMTEWIKHPSEFIPGTTMIFAGLTDKEDIDALIAYLKTL